MSRGVYVRGVSVQEGICPGVSVRGVHVRGGGGGLCPRTASAIFSKLQCIVNVCVCVSNQPRMVAVYSGLFVHSVDSYRSDM